MNTWIPFNSNICFTGAPMSGMGQMAAAIHNVAEAATSCGIPFFNQKVWIDPDSVLLSEGIERVQKMFSVADVFLGSHGPRGKEQGFYLLHGPLDIMGLAKIQNTTLPSSFSKTCLCLLEQLQLLVFQLPDPDGWRWQGFNQERIDWLTSYTKMLFDTAREYGMKLEQLRVLPALNGNSNMNIGEASWRIFGVGLNPLKLTDRIPPITSIARTYQAQCREIFEGHNGSVFGIPRQI